VATVVNLLHRPLRYLPTVWQGGTKSAEIHTCLAAGREVYIQLGANIEPFANLPAYRQASAS